MKAAILSNKPSFNLMKQTDVQSYYHLQMPRWLFFDKKYMSLSLEAKVTYTFLLNRFQLSRLNNWINADGEVFIIYTRESLATEIQISYRRVIDCMKELAAANLIWERRCGRGDANQIYLAKVELADENNDVYESAPFVATENGETELRPAETAHLDDADKNENPAIYFDHADLRPAENAYQEVRNSYVLTCENGTSRDAKSAVVDLQFLHPSNKDINNTDISYIDNSQSVSLSRARKKSCFNSKAEFEMADLKKIIDDCELWCFPEETAQVFQNAIERLYFSKDYRICNCTLPQQVVRFHLWKLNSVKLQEAERKISQNTDKEIKNTTAYVMAVIFNSIWETESDLMCDPYLNRMRSMTAVAGGG